MSESTSGFDFNLNHRNPSERLTFLLNQGIVAKREADKPRQYLGGSRLGETCERRLQYEFFNTPRDKPFDGKIYRIFQRGHVMEDAMVEWLRLAGFDLRTAKADGRQFGFSTCKDMIKGHIDGVICSGPDDMGPYPRLWECKCLGSKGWKSLESKGVVKAYPVYHGQMQLYMAYMQLTDNPALFTAINADTMEVYAESVPFDGAIAQSLSDKGVRIIKACLAGDILPRAAESSDSFTCKFCDYHQRCWSGE